MTRQGLASLSSYSWLPVPETHYVKCNARRVPVDYNTINDVVQCNPFICVMCTNIYTLYSQRKCLVDKQTQEQKASVAVPSFIQLSTYCAQKYDVNLRVSTVDSKTKCLATARWPGVFLYIFF